MYSPRYTSSAHTIQSIPATGTANPQPHVPLQPATAGASTTTSPLTAHHSVAPGRRAQFNVGAAIGQPFETPQRDDAAVIVVVAVVVVVGRAVEDEAIQIGSRHRYRRPADGD